MSQELATSTKNKELTKADAGFRGLLNDAKVKQRFNEVLGSEAAVFSASILTIYNGNRELQKCSHKSILNAAFQAAALKLPLTGGLGQAAIVPYGGQAQFQIMTRGYIQLAHRSGQYVRLNLAAVHKGELIEHDEFTGEVKLDIHARESDEIIGYFFFFQLKNGYRHEAYWSVERCIEHGKKFSKSFSRPSGMWQKNPHAMYAKTVVKNELAKWGPLSSEMQTAVRMDQAIMSDSGEPEYIDSTTVEDEADEIATPKRKSEAKKPATEQPGTADGLATAAESKMLHAIFNKSGKTIQEYKLFLDGLGLKSRKDIKAHQVSAIKAWLETPADTDEVEFPTK